MNEEQKLVLQTFQRNLSDLITEKFKSNLDQCLPQLSRKAVKEVIGADLDNQPAYH